MEYTPFQHFICTIALDPIEDVSTSVSHGVIEVYKKKILIGVLTADTIYLYTNKFNREYYIHAGSSVYSFQKKNGSTVKTKYYSVPAEIISKPKDFGQWVADAYRGVVIDKRKANT